MPYCSYVEQPLVIDKIFTDNLAATLLYLLVVLYILLSEVFALLLKATEYFGTFYFPRFVNVLGHLQFISNNNNNKVMGFQLFI